MDQRGLLRNGCRACGHGGLRRMGIHLFLHHRYVVWPLSVSQFNYYSCTFSFCFLCGEWLVKSFLALLSYAAFKPKRVCIRLPDKNVRICACHILVVSKWFWDCNIGATGETWHRLSFEQTQRNERIGEKTLSYLRLYHGAWTVSGIDDVLPVEVGKGVKETHPIIWLIFGRSL